MDYQLPTTAMSSPLGTNLVKFNRTYFDLQTIIVLYVKCPANFMQTLSNMARSLIHIIRHIGLAFLFFKGRA